MSDRKRMLGDAFEDLEAIDECFELLKKARDFAGPDSPIRVAMSAIQEARTKAKDEIRKFMAPPGAEHVVPPMVAHKGKVYGWSFSRNRPWPLDSIDAASTPIT